MILEAVRVLADWCAHPIHGVQAALGTLDYDAGDDVPEGVLTVIDETRDDAAASERPPTSGYPYLRVQSGDVRSLEGQAATYTHDAEIPLELLIAYQRTSNAEATRDCYYATRAVLQVVERLFDDTIPDAVTARDRNQVQIQFIVSLAAGRPDAPIEDNVVSAAVLVTLRCRDIIA